MKTLQALVSRNLKIFFKDKAVLLPSLIAPLILLFLFILFLGNVYRDSIQAAVGGSLSDELVESMAAGWLISSLLAVCAVSIAFTANTISVQDKASGQAGDLLVTPAPRSLIALSYFLATFLATSVVCLVALGAGFIYIAAVGWHLSVSDVFLCLADSLLLILFGTGLSSLVCHFLHSQGGVTAVQVIVSSAYGFLCGAYMPLGGGSLAEWMKDVLMFLPGTYGTGLLHIHLMGGAIDAAALPLPFAEALRHSFDCTLTFFGSDVPVWVCYLVLVCTVLAILGAYVLFCLPRKRHFMRKKDR